MLLAIVGFQLLKLRHKKCLLPAFEGVKWNFLACAHIKHSYFIKLDIHRATLKKDLAKNKSIPSAEFQFSELHVIVLICACFSQQRTKEKSEKSVLPAKNVELDLRLPDKNVRIT